MSFYDEAIEMKNEGEKFYLNLVSKTKNNGFKTILSMFANDDAKHVMIFKKMRKYENEVDKFSTSTKKIRNIIKKENNEEFINSLDQIELYNKALEIEKKYFNYYIQEMFKFDDNQQIETLERIIYEEHKHIELMEFIIDLATKSERLDKLNEVTQ